MKYEYRNPSRTGHGNIPPQSRTVSGIAALVTTPLTLASDECSSLLQRHTLENNLVLSGIGCTLNHMHKGEETDCPLVPCAR